MYAVGQALVTGPVDETVGRNDGIMGITRSTEGDEMLVVELDHDLLMASARCVRGPFPGGRLRHP
ncbi:hypothetical protein PV396_12950 [Streptomyces sp. ME02-8801-2C]|uniref:hypothetical protein n=1 Tax=Streptomyces sp. ME02-8801-2C TaxID=3028680 RepID=UPI0029BF819B|nr:hypothetical protein [Streptomyces sp. ME02-8801-2C]MDX3452847.1 hypothetical protein [Streptomyces sp. ME02-8801-2C]